MENKHTLSDLYQMQSLPLEAKIRMTEYRIRQWIEEYGQDGVYVSFSGGKDSTVLLDIVRNRMNYPDIPAVFVNVPTQYPELKDFALKWDNVTVLNPKKSFMQICEQYGFPLVSKEIAHKMNDLQISRENGTYSYVERQFKGEYVSRNGKTNKYGIQKWAFLMDAPFDLSHMCCNVLKKQPLQEYTKTHKAYGITATMAEESLLRTQQWIRNGCNGFNLKKPVSNPMSFWTEQDVLQYIKENDLPICSVYGDVVEDLSGTDEVEGQLTISDLIGFENEKDFDAKKLPLKTTGCSRTGCMLCGFGCHLEKKGEERFQILKETHPKMYDMLDIVKNKGVTMRQAIEWLNEHGNMNINL